MSYTRIRTVVVAAVLILVVTSCGGSSSNGSNSSSGMPNVALTVPGSPSAHVTDVVARGLTTEQADLIRKECQNAAPIPGTDQDCRNAIPAILHLPPCTPASHFCIAAGRIAGTQLAVMQISSPQPSSSQPGGSHDCSGRNVVLCKGIIVPAVVVAPLIGTSTTSQTASETTSGPTPTLTPTATPTPTPNPSTPVTPMPTTSVSSQLPAS